ncbi:unnamed protein product [Trichobilharzia szidati]|nr:unnamed protein product [Trichobilharzia szidati]
MYQTKNTEQKECTLKQLREKVEEMQVLYMEHDNQLREQMRSVLMNLEIEQTARKDASLEIGKSNVQLDVSKKSYYEDEITNVVDNLSNPLKRYQFSSPFEGIPDYFKALIIK